MDDAATAFVTVAALDSLGEVPVIVLPADPSVMGATGHEQYNHILSISDGTSVTVREWSQVKLVEFGWVLLEPITGKELGFSGSKRTRRGLRVRLIAGSRRRKRRCVRWRGVRVGRISARCTTLSPGQAVAPPPWRT